MLDALVACVTAATWAQEATIPGPVPLRDSCGLRMEMRCPASVSGLVDEVKKLFETAGVAIL